MRVLLTGGSGQLGSALLRSTLPQGWRLHAPNRRELDLARQDRLDSCLSDRAWDAVINCGAYTAVDRAEAEPEPCWAVNAVAPSVIAAWCARSDVPLLHISSDYVYAGDKSAPYVETDPVAPLSVYGAAKAAGDLAVTAAGGRHVILRTSWVVSPTGTNFVKTMVRLATERNVLKIVSDQVGAPTSADDLAAAAVRVLERFASASPAPSGVYHAVNGGETSWHGVAEAIFARVKAKGLPTPSVLPISTQDYPTPARRPSNSRLDGAKLERDYGVVFPQWRPSLDRIVDTLLEQGTRD